MSDCPCCSNTLIRQFRSHQLVWFCRHCWQEMPNISARPRAAASHRSAVAVSPADLHVPSLATAYLVSPQPVAVHGMSAQDLPAQDLPPMPPIAWPALASALPSALSPAASIPPTALVRSIVPMLAPSVAGGTAVAVLADRLPMLASA
jgi:hypothetical protein